MSKSKGKWKDSDNVLKRIAAPVVAIAAWAVVFVVVQKAKQEKAQAQK